MVQAKEDLAHRVREESQNAEEAKRGGRRSDSEEEHVDSLHARVQRGTDIFPSVDKDRTGKDEAQDKAGRDKGQDENAPAHRDDVNIARSVKTRTTAAAEIAEFRAKLRKNEAARGQAAKARKAGNSPRNSRSRNQEPNPEADRRAGRSESIREQKQKVEAETEERKRQARERQEKRYAEVHCCMGRGTGYHAWGTSWLPCAFGLAMTKRAWGWGVWIC